MNLALVRHGPTKWNDAGRFQGATDVPLSLQGRAFARAIASALRLDHVTGVYSSDLGRALETAQTVAAEHGATVVVDARLREFNFGRWEGRTWDEIVAAYPELSGGGSRQAHLYAPEGGETFADVCRRAASFLDSLRSLQPKGVTVVVTHAGVLHALFANLGLRDGAKGVRGSLRFSPAGITRITIAQDGPRLLSLDDVGHLDAAR